LKRRLANVVAIGPSGPPAADGPAEAVARQRYQDEAREAHHDVVCAEIVVLDERVRAIDDRLAKLEPGRSLSEEDTEIGVEKRILHALRADLLADMAEGPAFADLDGKPVGPERMAYIMHRARECRSDYFDQAARAAAQGDHRAARQWRVEGLRARHVALEESRIRRVSRYE
jgi:hypothetical protein